jgi:hypothetical protein
MSNSLPRLSISFTKITLNDLAQLIEKGFAAAKDDIPDLVFELSRIYVERAPSKRALVQMGRP